MKHFKLKTKIFLKKVYLKFLLFKKKFKKNNCFKKDYPIEFSEEFGSVDSDDVTLQLCQSKKPLVPVFKICNEEDMKLLNDNEYYLGYSDDDL